MRNLLREFNLNIFFCKYVSSKFLHHWVKKRFLHNNFCQRNYKNL